MVGVFNGFFCRAFPKEVKRRRGCCSRQARAGSGTGKKRKKKKKDKSAWRANKAAKQWDEGRLGDDVWVRSQAISALGKQGRWQDAVAVLAQTQGNRKDPPDVFLYNAHLAIALRWRCVRSACCWLSSWPFFQCLSLLCWHTTP
eukprot:TRINITY_DN25686_c0_g1_i1.p3 TRINITY_DN25686_c0_g1~~TRINITY_DN25686_c0_g1_i1.p3  ORF type:complete len:144 (-),score=18.16 TRINITY_DN25686_c0_g1_i1:231-662(-)